MHTVPEVPSDIQFDPNLSPESLHNLKAAQQRGWHFDYGKYAYVDREGAKVADKFGQPL
jgi:hypothetical protein